jgi:hypothetical protein
LVASFHTFRHTCATRLFRRGVNAVQVQMWLGHHSPAFTQAVYVHLLSSDLPDGDVLDDPGGNARASGVAQTGRDGEAPEGAETGSDSRSVSSDLAARSF